MHPQIIFLKLCLENINLSVLIIVKALGSKTIIKNWKIKYWKDLSFSLIGNRQIKYCKSLALSLDSLIVHAYTKPKPMNHRNFDITYKQEYKPM